MSASLAQNEVKLIQVHQPTHERLTALKLPGLTYEDVINFALDKLTPEEIEAHYRGWQVEAIAKLSKVTRSLTRRKS